MPRPAVLTAVVLSAAQLAFPTAARAQRADAERAVLAAVHRLFDGMRAGDSAAVRSVFHPGALLATALMRNGTPHFKVDTLESFIRAVGSPHDEIWDEKLYNTVVQVDGPLASVWTEYSFFAGDRFSHCGVDAFQLAQVESGDWRIVALTDTRRREGCRDEPAR